MIARINKTALAVLAPILLLAGIAGLAAPGHLGTSEAPPYDVFHIIAGTIGVLAVGVGLVVIGGCGWFARPT
jgi:hypothetical protein